MQGEGVEREESKVQVWQMVPSRADVPLFTCVLPCTRTQVGFRHPKDYVSYVWARSDDGERCLEKQLCAQVSWGQPCCLAGRMCPMVGGQRPLCAPHGAGGQLLIILC